MRRSSDKEILLVLGFGDVRPFNPHLPAHWEAARHGRRWLVVLERAAAGGRENLEARFARGHLRCQVAREELPYPDPRGTLVVIVAPALSHETEQALAAFAMSAGRGTEWLVTDGQRLLGPRATGTQHARRRRDRGERAWQGPRPPGGFSDRFLACVKALVLAEDPAAGAAELTSSLRGESFDVEALAEGAGVSIPHAYRFLRAYERMGFLEQDAAGIRLVRRAELFEVWSLRMVRQFEGGVVGSLSTADLDRWLKRAPAAVADARVRVAAGLHFAAAQHGAPEVAHAPLTLYVDGDPFDAADSLGVHVTPGSGGAGAVEFIRPIYPAAMRRGLLIGDSGWPITDAVQCYIDLLRHPRRGREAAQALLRRHPRLLGDRGRET